MFTLITGATGVLGTSFCEACLERGENLCLTGRSADKLALLSAALAEKFPSAGIVYFACDLSDEKSRAEFFANAGRYVFSRVINCAGADIQKPFCEYTQEKLVFQVRVNFEAAAAVCLFALSHCAENMKIINISSMSGIVPMPYFALYSASKRALTDFSAALSAETKGTATVTAIVAGAIYTRSDVIEYIKTQGFWGRIAAKSPRYIAEKSLKAADKGKNKYIPGLANRIMNAVVSSVPSGIRLAYIKKRWSRTRKDAF